MILTPNPFRVLRVQHNLSQFQIARLAGISRHAVVRSEQGMYDSPLPSLINFYTDKYAVSRATLIDDYAAFQKNQRGRNGRVLGDIAEHLLNWTPSIGHPLAYLRVKNHMNGTQLAKCLCISQTVIAYFETKYVQQKTVPQQLLRSLEDAGYSPRETKLLIEAYEDYREARIRPVFDALSVATSDLATSKGVYTYGDAASSIGLLAEQMRHVNE